MKRVRPIFARRFFSTLPARRNARPKFNSQEIERAEDDVDVCIIGGGPAGLSAGIRLKQLEAEKGREVRVVILEKGSEVGKSSKSCRNHVRVLFVISLPSNISQIIVYLPELMLFTRCTHTFGRCHRTPRIERTTTRLEVYGRPSINTARSS